VSAITIPTVTITVTDAATTNSTTVVAAASTDTTTQQPQFPAVAS